MMSKMRMMMIMMMMTMDLSVLSHNVYRLEYWYRAADGAPQASL